MEMALLCTIVIISCSNLCIFVIKYVLNIAVENILAEPTSKVTPRSQYIFKFPRCNSNFSSKVKVIDQDHRSNQGHTIPLQTTVPSKCQQPTPYRFRDRAWTRFLNSMSKVKSRSHHHFCTPTPPNQCPYQVLISYIQGVSAKFQYFFMTFP